MEVSIFEIMGIGAPLVTEISCFRSVGKDAAVCTRAWLHVVAMERMMMHAMLLLPGSASGARGKEINEVTQRRRCSSTVLQRP